MTSKTKVSIYHCSNDTAAYGSPRFHSCSRMAQGKVPRKNIVTFNIFFLLKKKKRKLTWYW